MTSEVELLMLLGDKVVKLYEKDKEIKELRETLVSARDEIRRLLELVEDGRLVTSSIK